MCDGFKIIIGDKIYNYDKFGKQIVEEVPKVEEENPENNNNIENETENVGNENQDLENEEEENGE